MIFREYAPATIVILIVSSLVLLLSQDWRKMVLGLALQYIGVFWLAATVWPPGLAVVKLVVGWMVAAVLGVSRPALELVDEASSIVSARFFKLLVAVILLIVILVITPELDKWLTVNADVRRGGMVLIGMGVLHLGLTTRPFRIILGLLTTLAGFEVIYAAVENSVLVTGLLAVINLGIVMVGSYLIIGTSAEENV